jgi:hypothetical protein
MAKVYYGQGVQPATRGDVDMLALIDSLPPIVGHWYFVDPTSGNDGASGQGVSEAVKSIETAYDLCVSGAGDGICLLSRGTGTASQTTSYLTQELAWSKHGITVYGVCAPTKSYQRARVANKTITTTAALTVAAADLKSITRASGSFITDGWVSGMKLTLAGDQTTSHIVDEVGALTVSMTTDMVASAGGISSATSYMANLITMSGSNNRFVNVMLWNGGTAATEIGGLVVSGNRNTFENCHIVGGAGAAAAATKYSVKIDVGQENLFLNGTIGSDTFDHGNNADVEVILNNAVARNRFDNVEFMSFVSTGTAHGAVKSVSTSGGSPTMFQRCLFNSLLSATKPAAVHLTSGSVDKVGFAGCSAFNFTAWGGYADMATSAASAGGGLATTA